MWTIKPSDGHHWLSVKTGDRKGAETDAIIKTILHDVNKASSGVITLNDDKSGGYRPFNKGCISTRQAPLLNHLGPLAQIELWREATEDATKQEDPADWYCELISVKDTRDMKDYYFPVHRWLQPATRYWIPVNDTWLPAQDPNPEQRKEQLKRSKDLYAYGQKDPNPLAQVKHLPPDEMFSEAYAEIIGKPANVPSRPNIVRWKTLDELKVLYKELGFDMVKGMDENSMNDDRVFAAQRLAGVNPVMIQLCKELPKNLGINVDELKPLMDGLTVPEAISQNKLYITDYKELEDFKMQTEDPKDFKNKEATRRKFVAPVALWFLDNEKCLLPIAIQLYQDGKDPQNPVFLCNDSCAWKLAKMWLNLADSNIHQSVCHLGFTHLLMDGVWASANCCLASNHPVYRLLAPHFLYLLPINKVAITQLLYPADGSPGYVDSAMAIGAKQMMELVDKRFDTWRLDVQGTLPEDLSDRNVRWPDQLPCYPYRDDGMLVYDAIKNYVTKIVQHSYGDDSEKLRTDAELQAWGQDLTRPRDQAGVGIKGVPDDGRFQSTTSLITTLTSFIFTCSAQHAAVNFGQYDQYGYPPNYPAFLMGEPPKDKDAALTEEDLVRALPDKARSIHTLAVTAQLSQRATNKLGAWEFKYQYDPLTQDAERTFREELARASSEIRKRNIDRPPYLRYDYLNPEGIPNAISI